MMNRPNKRKFWMFPVFGAAFLLLGGLAVMFLWNAILPVVINSVGPLTYIQAIGLLILCRLLFGGFKGRSNHYGYGGGGFRNGFYMKEKMAGMSEEEKEKFKAEWRARCGPRP